MKTTLDDRGESHNHIHSHHIMYQESIQQPHGNLPPKKIPIKDTYYRQTSRPHGLRNPHVYRTTAWETYYQKEQRSTPFTTKRMTSFFSNNESRCVCGLNAYNKEDDNEEFGLLISTAAVGRTASLHISSAQFRGFGK